MGSPFRWPGRLEINKARRGFSSGTSPHPTVTQGDWVLTVVEDSYEGVPDEATLAAIPTAVTVE